MVAMMKVKLVHVCGGEHILENQFSSRFCVEWVSTNHLLLVVLIASMRRRFDPLLLAFISVSCVFCWTGLDLSDVQAVGRYSGYCWLEDRVGSADKSEAESKCRNITSTAPHGLSR